MRHEMEQWIQYEMMIDDDEYSMKFRCKRVRYEIHMLMNTAWNEDANEHGMKLIFKWIRYEMNEFHLVWNGYANECKYGMNHETKMPINIWHEED